MRSYLQRPVDGGFSRVSPEDVARLVAQAPTVKTALLLQTLWSTGARICEVLDLRAKDLDARRSLLTLRRRKRRKDFPETLPIPQALAQQIRQYLLLHRRRGRIFSGTRHHAWRSIRDLGRRVLGRSISPKSFRHGKAYEMVKKGIHPLLIARALGHAQIASTLQYFHPSEADLREALGALN